jgi:poly-gamma-glutamate capsule biosynthesis protein CapA/YwtB (metallophosphatase superfamily)
MTEPVTIAVTGDVMLGRLVNRAIQVRGHEYVWGNILPLLKDADLTLVNLECALTSRTEPWHDDFYKPFHFRAEPDRVQTLQAAGIDFVSLANNHIADFGMPGLLETVEVLDRASIAHAGAGPHLAGAREPARLRADGLRVAIVAAADYPRHWAATPDSAGMNYVEVSVDDEDFAPIAGSLRAARGEADLVVFSIHWGPNMRLRPPPDFRDFARAVIDAGADVFWGHSAHVVQGIEVWNGKPILYDTGDFVDDYAVDPQLRNDLSALFLLRVRDSQVEEIEIVPAAIGEMQVNLAHRTEREFFLDRLAELSAELGTEVVKAEGKARVSIAGSIPTESGEWTRP